ncbi:hypothetical protein TYRP_022928 [Tyrophagus putrescentiae]|nr:hypothetical protein TYRP_022928 [Tyrophagus putrescentiae]
MDSSISVYWSYIKHRRSKGILKVLNLFSIWKELFINPKILFTSSKRTAKLLFKKNSSTKNKLRRRPKTDLSFDWDEKPGWEGKVKKPKRTNAARGVKQLCICCRQLCLDRTSIQSQTVSQLSQNVQGERRNDNKSMERLCCSPPIVKQTLHNTQNTKNFLAKGHTENS